MLNDSKKLFHFIVAQRDTNNLIAEMYVAAKDMLEAIENVNIKYQGSIIKEVEEITKDFFFVS